MILCDIGNSTFHFLIDENDFKISVDENLELDIFHDVYGEVYFISVNEKATDIFLNKFPQAIDLKNKIEFESTYASTLGIDRKVACKLFDSGIVVDFGSAITVDIMENQKHLGGYILPGIESLKMAYPQISPKLKFGFKTNSDLDRLPQDTDEAISFAIVKLIVAFINDIQKEYDKKLFFTGETAKPFLDYFENYEFQEKLIFTSMKKIIEEIK